MANNEDGETLDLALLDPGIVLKSKGIYYITGAIEIGSLLEIHQDILLKHLDSNWNDDIQLIINSVGGVTWEGWALVDLLNWIKMDVRTVGMGVCASLGTILLSSGTKGKRVISKNTTVMVHGASGVAEGNIQQLVGQMKDMTDEHERMVGFWIENSKYKTKKEIEEKLLDGSDHYMTAKEALSHGIVDYIVDTKSKKGKKDGR